MADVRKFCPECGAIDPVVSLMGSAVCACGWEGPATATVGVVTTNKFWGVQELAEALLRVATKHAAGPIYQVYVEFGILQPGDEEGRTKVMKAVFEGMIEKSFEAASQHLQEKPNG